VTLKGFYVFTGLGKNQTKFNKCLLLPSLQYVDIALANPGGHAVWGLQFYGCSLVGISGSNPARDMRCQSFVSVVCGQAEVLATDRSLVQRSPTEGLCKCWVWCCVTTVMRPRPNGVSAHGKKICILHFLIKYLLCVFFFGNLKYKKMGSLRIT
jgi:hypothetical protein